MTALTFHWENLSDDEAATLLRCGDAGRLSQLDPEYVCRYACEDTDSTYLFWKHILGAALQKFPELEEFHRVYGGSLVEMVTLQRLVGVQLDMPQLERHEAFLTEALAAALTQLAQHPEIREGIEAFHNLILEAVEEHEPKDKYAPRKYPNEPKKLTRKGEPSPKWEEWRRLCDAIDREPPSYNRKWEAWWAARCSVAEKIRDYWNLDIEERATAGLFNIFSTENRKWLFYDYLKFPVLVLTDKDAPSTSGNALLGFGEVGKIFDKIDEVRKEQQFCASLRKVSDLETGVYHPRLKVPGTHTGRLSGDGGFNFQNPPKSRGFLEVFAPRPGCALVDYDATALEPTVLAEVSRDPGLLSVYGPAAKKGQDIYLYVGSAFPGIGDTFRAAGYNPKSPDPEVTSRIKKEYKELRNVCKIAHLSASYGAGAKKWHQTFSLQGFKYSLGQCQQFHEAYWKLFKSIKDHEAQLLAQWEKNGGWLLDALGLPFCVDSWARKDLINRKIQRSGHEVLMVYQKVVRDTLMEAGIPFIPWCWDYHDQLLIEVPASYAQEADCLLSGICFDKLNSLLSNKDTIVKLRGTGGIMRTLAESKLDGG